MPRNWSRRAPLATFGVAALAGCSLSPEDSPASPTPTDTPGTPRVVNGTAYVPAGRAIHALSPGDGTETWNVETGPLGDLVVASHGLYYVRSGEPTVVALDSDGTERWETTIEDPWEPTVFAGPEQVFVPTGTHNPQPWKLAAETGEVRNDRPPENQPQVLQ